MQFWNWVLEHRTEIAVIAVAVVALLVSVICLIIVIHKHKNKSAVGKIFKTTDGYLKNQPRNKKKRWIAVAYQRKSDGAVAIVKIYKLDDKQAKVGKNYIPELILSPQTHSSLKEDSIVGRRVIWGIATKEEDTKNYKQFFIRDFESTNDRLTAKELTKVLSKVQNENPKFRATHLKTLKKWRNGFKK